MTDLPSNNPFTNGDDQPTITQLAEQVVPPGGEVEFSKIFELISYDVQVIPSCTADFCRDRSSPDTPAALEFVSIATLPARDALNGSHASYYWLDWSDRSKKERHGVFYTGQRIVIRVRNSTDRPIQCSITLNYLTHGKMLVVNSTEGLVAAMAASDAAHEALNPTTQKKDTGNN